MRTFDLTYISLGAGRQSTALAICSALGLHGVPKADCAIFSDTGDEIKDTYDHVETFSKWLGERGIVVHVVKQGNLGNELIGLESKARKGFIVSIPAFTENKDGKEGVLRRQCTQEYKINPIERKVRELLGYQKGDRIAGKKMARAMLGIAVDEVGRAKTSRTKWIFNHYPLLDALLRTNDCLKICNEHLGYTPVKSACRFCPYHDNRYWSWMKKDRPEEFEKAVEVDEGIRDLTRAGAKNPVFLHRSLKPLNSIDFDAPKEPGQMELFGNECEGHCGV